MRYEELEFKDRRKGFISRRVPLANRNIIVDIFKNIPDLNFEYFEKFSNEERKPLYYDILILPKKEE